MTPIRGCRASSWPLDRASSKLHGSAPIRERCRGVPVARIESGAGDQLLELMTTASMYARRMFACVAHTARVAMALTCSAFVVMWQEARRVQQERSR